MKMILGFKDLMRYVYRTIFIKIKRYPYNGQHLEFENTLNYFNNKNNLHTNKIKKSGIESRTIELIGQEIAILNKISRGIKIIDIGTGDGELIGQVVKFADAEELTAIEPLLKFHNAITNLSKHASVYCYESLSAVPDGMYQVGTLIGVAAYMDDSTLIDTLGNISNRLVPGGILAIRSVLKHKHPEVIEVHRKLNYAHGSKNERIDTYMTIRRTLDSELNLIASHFTELKLRTVRHLGNDSYIHIWSKI